jgi:magnesium-transporting ATPase (P-type)
LIGKSNILTTGRMRVKSFHLEGVTKLNQRPDTILNCELNQRTIDLIGQGILLNNSAYVQMGETKFVPVGDNTEVGLLKFLQNADIPIHTEILRRYDSNIVIASVPLRTKSTGMFYTACAVNEGNNMVSIHIKGAPAAILPLASHICGDAGNAYVLDDHSRAAFIREVEKMAACPLR